MKMRFWLRPLLALAAAGVCLFLLGRLTRPKYTEGILEGGLIDDYYEETGGHQVLFIGDCEVYESFTPPTLFAEYPGDGAAAHVAEPVYSGGDPCV